VSKAFFLVPGSFNTRTGGSIYDRRMVGALRDRGWSVDVVELGGAFPDPSEEELKDGAAALAACPDRSIVVVDGLCFGAMPDIMLSERARLRLVPVIHLPLADEFGLDAATALRRADAERRALTAASIVVVTGRETFAAQSRFGVSPDRVVIVRPGTDAAPISRGSSGPGVHLLCVAAFTPGKGHDLLIRSLAGNRDLSWSLTCVGSTNRCPATVADFRTTVARYGLDDRVSATGELDDEALAARFDEADLFVLATRHETFGMAVAEAIARGIPVVSTATGEIPAIVGPDAGILTAPGDVAALTTALSRVIRDATYRNHLRGGAIKARGQLERWSDAAIKMESVLEQVSA
jgi:glycosyltransferase involved in cell wall biosynthesis